MAMSTSVPPTSEAGPSRLSPIIVKQENLPTGEQPAVLLHAVPKKRVDRAVAFVEARKRESMQERLQRHIESAQQRLEAVKKEEENAKKAVEVFMAKGKDKVEEDTSRKKFNELILE